MYCLLKSDDDIVSNLQSCSLHIGQLFIYNYMNGDNNKDGSNVEGPGR
jgi:hypothetical protein